MFQTGKTQRAYVNRFSDYGAYLSDELNGENEVLLPKKLVKENMEVDQEIEVFIYRDSEKRLVATTKKPLIELGGIAVLEVTGNIENGFFLNMGLDKDLYLPYNEAKGQLRKGQKCLVTMYIDFKDQLCASMKIYNYLTVGTDYKVGQHVNGTVIEIKPDMGAFFAVDDRYHGLIPKHELYKEIKEGAKLEARITRIREDGRFNLSIKEKAHVQINSDVDILLKALEESEGELYLNDDSDPEIIRKRLNLSKRAFKRAVGKLLKENKITIFEDGIRLVE